MSDHQKSPALFIAGHAALDLLNSVAAPHKDLIDWIETGQDLLGWLVQADLITQAERNTIVSTARAEELEQIAKVAREFREQFRDFLQQSLDQQSPRFQHPVLKTINHELTNLRQCLRLELIEEEAGTKVQLVRQPEIQSSMDILPRLAQICAEFIAHTDFALVKNCEGPTCTLFFQDTSKSRRRRWCSMQVCGNRAKAQAHRKKLSDKKPAN